jgi:cytidylate kinase
VRAVCPLDQRIAGLVERRGIDVAEARAEVAATDAERRAFVKDHFKTTVDDPSLFDLEVNTGTLGVEGAADVVVAAYRARFPR